ncbi:MAG: hypothetical protein H5U21_03205 [Porphyrobacter sp.]|nr:hypothetical protein [Porphyrobacter sp.]
MLSEPTPIAGRRGRRNHPAEILRKALLELGANKATITEHKERSWASITFAGTRHQIDLSFDGAAAVEAGERFIAHLPEHLFDIPGQLVADAAVVSVDHRLSPEPQMRVCTEVLLLEDS